MGERGRPGLTDQQAERVVAAMRRLLAERFDNVITRLAKAIGRKQPSVSNNLSKAKKTKPSLETAERVAKLAGQFVWELLGDEPPRDAEVDPLYPNRGVAIWIARRDGYSEEAIATVRAVVLKEDGDPRVTEWLIDIRDEDTRQRRHAAPASAKVVAVKPLALPPHRPHRKQA